MPTQISAATAVSSTSTSSAMQYPSAEATFLRNRSILPGTTTGTGVGNHARVREGATAEKEGGSVVRRTQEPDRAASSEIAPDAVRARTILPGGYGTKSQTASAVP